MLANRISRPMIGAALCLFCIPAFAAKSPAEDPDELLKRIRLQMLKHLSQLPKYTCREVIDRMVGRPASGSLQPLDRVELEVAFSGQSELFAATAEAQFQEQPIYKVVPTGTISDSPLGSHVDGIFLADIAEFKYAGTAKKDGHKTFRFDFRVPQEKSHFLVRHNSMEAYVAFKGSIWADAVTLDLIRVDLQADHIAARIGVVLVEESMHYELMRIGNSDFELPRHSLLTTADDAGYYSVNDVHLDGCREFSGQSVVTYGAPVTARRDDQEP